MIKRFNMSFTSFTPDFFGQKISRITFFINNSNEKAKYGRIFVIMGIIQMNVIENLMRNSKTWSSFLKIYAF